MNTLYYLKDHEVNPRTREGRTAIAKMLMRLFDHWKLSPKDQLALLGLRSRTSLARYRKGEPIADRRNLLDHVATIFSIHMSLRTLFSNNKDILYGWISIPNRAFDGQKPVEVIREKGFSGLLLVKKYLDHEVEGDG